MDELKSNSDIKRNLDIVTVVQRYVELTKLGPGYSGFCPFCQTTIRKTFLVQLRFNTFTCSNCKIHGGIFRFLITLNKYSLQQAIEEVKGIFNIEFDGIWTDARWKKVFQDTDFNNVLHNLEQGKQKQLIKGPAEQSKEVSYSSLSTYLQCPYRYKRRYIDREKDEKLLPFVSLGRSLHLTLSKFYRHVINAETNDKDVDNLLNIYQDTWISRGYADDEEEQQWRAYGIQMLITYMESEYASIKPILIEKQFKAIIGESVLVGKLDRIDKLPNGTYEIIDYKIGGFESEEERQAQEIQTSFYYLGAKYGLNLEIEKITYYYLASSTYLSIDYFPIEQFRNSIESIVHTIANDTQFKAKRNLFCQNCAFTNECPLEVGEKVKIKR